MHVTHQFAFRWPAGRYGILPSNSSVNNQKKPLEFSKILLKNIVFKDILLKLVSLRGEEPPMPRDGENTLGEKLVTPELELAVLAFWAAAMDVKRRFSRQEIEALPELSRAIAAAHLLPAAIGWDDVLADQIAQA